MRRYNLRKMGSTPIEVEKLLEERMKDLATKSCIQELKDIILKQGEAIAKQQKDIELLRQEVSLKNEKIEILESKLSILESAINVLKKSSHESLKANDDNEQYNRRLCLRINGISVDEKESSEESLKKVKSVFTELDVNIPDECVDRAHRIGIPTKDKNGVKQHTMIVRFTTWRHRTAVYRARKKSRKYIIHFDLTKKRLNLLKNSREFLNENPQSHINFVFADVNCRLMAKLSNGKFQAFESMEELKDMCVN